MLRKYAVTVVAVPCMLMTLAACVPPPSGPSVVVLPTQGKPFEKFQAEDAQCRDWARVHAGDPQGAQNNVATGAVVGTAAGAGLGAALGSASGNAGTGAAIGAASGLLFGTAMGADAGQSYARAAQNRYDNAYIQCMYAYGNQVPQQQRKVVVAAPAPPPPVVVAPPPPAYMPPPVEVVQASPVPDSLYLESAPMFAYAPEYGMYVALGVPYDLMYDGRQYYYHSNGFWYASPYYSGPWMYMAREAYPPVFVSFRIERFHEFREREYRAYRRDPSHYHGRMHNPEFRSREVVRRGELDHRQHRQAEHREADKRPFGQKPGMTGKGAPLDKGAQREKAAPVRKAAAGKPAKEKAEKSEKSDKKKKD